MSNTYIIGYNKAVADPNLTISADEIRRLCAEASADELLSLGFKKWGKFPAGLYLFPQGWVDAVPGDVLVTSINGKRRTAQELRDEGDGVWDDVRFGVLAHGIDVNRKSAN